MVLSMQRKLIAVFSVASLLLYVFFTQNLILHYPIVWSDEADFATPAINLLEQGRMGNSLWTGALPGIEERTYWMPPAYFVTVAAVFRLFGVGVLQLRLLSVFAALGVMAGVYRLGRAGGLDRVKALFPVGLLGVDLVFIRGSLIGRMDMLTLALIVLALNGAVQARDPAIAPAGRRRWLVLGGVGGALAALTHPFGVVALLALAVAAVQREWRRTLTDWLLLGGVTLLVMLPWLVYLAQDWQGFVTQLTGQIARKSNRVTPGLRVLLSSAKQYDRGSFLALGFWGLGLLGLVEAARRDARLRVLLYCQIAALGLMLWSHEMWYPVHVAPLSMLGTALLLFRERPGLSLSPRTQWAMGGVVATIVVIWGGLNLSPLVDKYSTERLERAPLYDYDAYTQQLSALLPQGATVFIAAFPDPTLGLHHRQDLKLRHFVPMPLTAEEYARYIEPVDYFVLSSNTRRENLPPELPRAAMVGRVVGDEVGGYNAQVYRVDRSDSAAVEH